MSEKGYKLKLSYDEVRTIAVTFLIALLSGLVVISIYFFSFIKKPQPETAEVFSELYRQCTNYVEKLEVFNTSSLVQGDIDASGNSTFNGREENLTWHHAKELFVVRFEENVSQGRNRRQCSIGLSSNGKRPPFEAIGLVVLEYFSLRRKFMLIDDTHRNFNFGHFTPETIAFRSNNVDEFGCAVVHSFSVDTVGESFTANIFQIGIACGISN